MSLRPVAQNATIREEWMELEELIINNAGSGGAYDAKFVDKGFKLLLDFLKIIEHKTKGQLLSVISKA